jgi:Uma2 family endonuclease
MTHKEFRAFQPDNDGWKYEWKNGKIEVNEIGFISKDRSIINTLIRAFTRTVHFEEGWLYADARCEFESLGVVRFADLAYFTEKQYQSLRHGGNPVPAFVVEIVHDSDRSGKLRMKCAEYFRAGVRCVWFVYPDSERVRVYISPQESKLCRKSSICQASPALNDFSLMVKELFEYA